MSDTQLTVTLSGGGVDDARAVVRVLEGTFGASDGLPSDDRATVRTATFGAEDHGEAGPGSTGAARLAAPVEVTVQGTPEAVRRASDTLAEAFTVRDDGASAGDQEQERQLLLEP
ncbi:hypothetical protein G3I31_10585 [Streptomyces sp. SID9913]|uniref:Uncharacterized protein n=2 Tax=unclassified Streptomyces TaxID=2593676 RepID=A0A6G3QQ94_9ACTN|nr:MULTISPECIES: hypothetical protein [unclassified Streptomyces]NEA85668.1 hypothetical protein [Streptomyces sp. SID14436]NEC81396.1 hypothetical protein [Streptomyces sp. SID7958]NED18572.1 hypothetical protein [Streptomyces sp. SID9913]